MQLAAYTGLHPSEYSSWGAIAKKVQIAESSQTALAGCGGSEFCEYQGIRERRERLDRRQVIQTYVTALSRVLFRELAPALLPIPNAEGDASVFQGMAGHQGPFWPRTTITANSHPCSARRVDIARLDQTSSLPALTMQKNESMTYYGMLGLSLVFTILAVVTMLPNPAAAKPNVLGYRSVCSFAPAASALCGLLAGVTCAIRNRRFSRSAASARYKPLIVPIGVAVLLLAAAAVFGIRFGVAQSRFGTVIAKTEMSAVPFVSLADGTRSATVSEGDVSATVELTVTAGSIGELRLTSGKNVDSALAARIFAEVRKAGSVAVDAVSGATASSNVLLRAIERAATGGSP